MKNIILFLLFGILFLTSCSTQENFDLECEPVTYDDFFTVKANQAYCFDDGNEILVLKLENAFCPCNVLCGSEGEMNLHYQSTMDGVTKEGVLGSSINHYSADEWYPYTVNVTDVVFEVPCSEAVPSPNIVSCKIRINQNPTMSELILGCWHLDNVSGGFGANDIDYNYDDVITCFSNINRISVTVSDSTDIISDFPFSGSYEYGIIHVNDKDFLTIEGNEYGELRISNDGLTIDQNSYSLGQNADGFFIKMVR